MVTTIAAARAARLALACALAFAAGAASAQKVYRSVGPDGKVTFSDQPPADGGDATMIRGGGSPAPAAAPDAPAAEAPAAPGAPLRGGPKQALRPGAAPTAAASPVVLDEALQRSLVKLLANENIVARFERVCNGTLPTSMRKFSGAADQWRARHAVQLGQRDRILNALATPAQRSRLAAAVRADGQKLYAPIEQADAARRIKWCDDNTQELNTGKLDSHQDPSVSAPLADALARIR